MHALHYRLCELFDKLEDMGRGHLFIEAPMPAHVASKHGTTLDTSIALNGYISVAEMVAHWYEVDVTLIERQDALKHFTGRRTYPEKDDGKRACLKRAQSLGWSVNGLDEADACAIFDYGCAVTCRELFAKVAGKRPFIGGR